MRELKQCPFCGGEASIWSRGGRSDDFAWIECETCGSRTKVVTTQFPANDAQIFHTPAYSSLKAIWNRRVTDELNLLGGIIREYIIEHEPRADWLHGKDNRFYCSSCMHEAELDVYESRSIRTPYCSWCGCKMDFEGEDDVN